MSLYRCDHCDCISNSNYCLRSQHRYGSSCDELIYSIYCGRCKNALKMVGYYIEDITEKEYFRYIELSKIL